MIKHWNRLHREVVHSLPVKIFKTHLDVVLGNLLQMALLEQVVRLDISKGHFQPQ